MLKKYFFKPFALIISLLIPLGKHGRPVARAGVKSDTALWRNARWSQ